MSVTWRHTHPVTPHEVFFGGLCEASACLTPHRRNAPGSLV